MHLALGCAVVATACSTAKGASSEYGAPRATVGLAPIESSTVSSGAAGTTTDAETTAAATTVAATTAPPTTARPTTTAKPTTTAAPVSTVPRTTAAPVQKTNIPVSDISLTPLSAVGRQGGEGMKRVQARLVELGFWVSAVDGQYGLSTRQAVMAFQKYVGLPPAGDVDDWTAAALTDAKVRANATAIDGNLVEIDKTKQLLFLVEDGFTIWIFNTSTGSGKHYIETNLNDGTPEEGDAITDSGVFRVYREKPEGWWDGDLGKIYRPKYFNGGMAIHGMNTVPGHPVSHGCVRLSLPAMDFIWANNLIPKGTTVWVHGQDPPPT